MEHTNNTNAGSGAMTASKTLMTSEIHSFERRGCYYKFEGYGIENGENVVQVYAFGANDKIIWDGSAGWADGDTVADLLRWAKDTHDTRRKAGGW